MIAAILLAILNGAFIGASRALNGRLSLATHPFHASFWNHLVGFAALSLVLLAMGALTVGLPGPAPVQAYLGGVLGALYVAINSHVLPRLGALKAMLLVISGQMMTGLVIDTLGTGLAAVEAPRLGLQVGGVLLLVWGVYLGKRPSPAACYFSRKPRERCPSD